MHRISRLSFSSKLLEAFPEYMDTERYKLAASDNYSVAAGFGFYLRDLILHDRQPLKRPTVKKAFEWINSVFNSDSTDREVLNVLGVEVFETLAGSKEAAKLAREVLKGKAMDSFEETARLFGT